MNCEGCYYQDEVTGACTNDAEECVDGDQFVKALGPEDMFKTLFMVIYNLGGELEVSVKELEDETEMKIEHRYDPKTRRFIMTTNPQPPKPTLIKVPKKLMKPRKRLIYPGMN